jgi:hypothetical protein
MRTEKRAEGSGQKLAERQKRSSRASSELAKKKTFGNFDLEKREGGFKVQSAIFTVFLFRYNRCVGAQQATILTQPLLSHLIP